MANWFYYDRAGQKQGPYDGEQIKYFAEQGILTPEMMLEDAEGQSAPAGNAKGLRFAQTTQHPFQQPAPNPFTAAESNPFIDSPFDDSPLHASTANAVGMSDPIMRGYRDPGWISFFTIFFIVILLILNAVAIPGNMMERDVLLKIQAGAYETEEEWEAAANMSNMIQSMIGITTVVFACISRIFWFVWTYRIVKNAHCLTYRPLRFGPGWAVGYYFIPILNLFRPYQALSDAYRVSKNPSDWAAASGSYLLGWWWGLFLLSSYAANVDFRLAIAAQRTPEEGLIGALLLSNMSDTIVNLTVDPLNSLLALLVVWKLCYSQHEAHQQVVSSPPPPIAHDDMYEPLPSTDDWVLPSHTSGWAIVAGYAGLFAVLVFPAPVALILGIMALRDCNRRSIPGRGRAIFAIVMGSVFSLCLLLMGILALTG